MQRIVVIFVFFIHLLALIPSKAQKKEPLEIALAQAKGAKKIDLLNKISLFYRRKDPSKSIKLANQALKLAQNRNYSVGIAQAYIRLGKVALSPQRHYKEAVGYFQKALAVAKNSNNSLIEADASNLSGITYRRLGQYDLALSAYQNAFRIANTLQNKKLMAKYLSNIGVLYRQISSYNKSLKSYLKALKLLESLGSKRLIARTLNNIGNVYYNLKDYKEAINYYLQALKLQQVEIKSKRSIIHLLGNLGVTFFAREQYEEALNYHERQLKASTKLNYRPGIASALVSTGNIYQQLKQYKEALEYQKEALKYRKKTDTEGLMVSYHMIGNVYQDLNEVDSAIVYSKIALQKAQILKNKRMSLGIFKSLTELHLRLNQSKEAQKYFRQYLAVADEEFEAGKVKEVNKLKVIYETEKKEQQLSLKNKEYTLLLKENEIQQLALSQAELARLTKEKKLKILVQQRKLQNTELARQRLISKNEQKKAALLKKQQEILAVEAKRQKENIKYQRTIRNFSLVGVAFLFIFLALLFVRYRQKQQSNRQLKEKNIEIEIQRDQINMHRLELEEINDQLKFSNEDIQNKKAEIEAQRDLLSNALDEISVTNQELSHSKNKIIDSIRYASRIQGAVLSSSLLLKEIFPQSFILFKPRDIVSGDFYWFAERGERKIVIAADCTGHGVPGAFMSVLGTTLLNQIVREENITDPLLILESLDKRLQETLHVVADDQESLADGMDMAILTIDIAQEQVLYAGAKNNLYFVTNGEFRELKASSYSLGYSFYKKKFTQQVYDYQPGDTFYISSDGYQDQFGGKTANGKKFMRRRFKNLLHKVSLLPLSGQGEELDQTIEEWKGDRKQTDDILIIGVQPA